METRKIRKRGGNFCGRTRREFLWQAGGGFTGVALAAALGDDGFLQRQTLAADGLTPYRNPLRPRPSHLPARAKSVIFLFMYGGPSQIDTFDYKPAMKGMDNKTVEVKTFGRAGHRQSGRIVEPRWNFKQYGQCGKWVSDLFPHLGACVDDIAFLHSMTADSPIHGSAMLMMNSGRILSGSPCLGSWINYGLGTVNENLPGFVVMLDPRGGPISGAKNWSSGYMPATYQATVMRSRGKPILDLAPPEGVSPEMQREMLDSLGAFNREHYRARRDNSNLAARIASYELAFRMQRHAPEAVDLSWRTPGHWPSTGWTARRRRCSGGSACWPGGWWSGESDSFRSIQGATMGTPTGTPTETSSPTTICTPSRPTSPSPAC